MPAFPSQMLIFGCGNMGGAMLRGWIAGGVDASRFTVVDPVASNLPQGVTVHRAASDVSRKFDAVLLGIKPQMMGSLAPEIAPLLDADALMISILAGTETTALAAHFPTARIVRLMPNLAAAIGKSPLGLWTDQLDESARANLEAMLAPLGASIWLTSEDQMNAVTALAGSGPAFVYRFIDALGEAGTRLGLDAKQSAAFALSMVEGAALLAAGSSESPLALAARVTSPGGTTAAGLAVLDAEHALFGLIEATLRAASDRGAELAMAADKP
ncbi:MAG: pyrroline-5-carboxylate reductase [Sphingorhabdus sp.]